MAGSPSRFASRGSIALVSARAGSAACCSPTGGVFSPLIDSLKPRIPDPSERPISGSRLAPKISSTMTSRKRRWMGLSSPTMVRSDRVVGWVSYEPVCGTDHSAQP